MAFSSTSRHPSAGSDVDGTKHSQQLKKSRSVIGGIVFIINYMVGSGIFLTPRLVLVDAGSIGMALVVWFVCGAIVLMGASVNVEMGCMYPKAGGLYQYLFELIHQAASFLYSWTYLVLIAPSALAAASLTMSDYLLFPFFDCPISSFPRLTLAILAIWVFVIINAFSVDFSRILDKIFAAFKIAVLSSVILMGIFGAAKGGYRNFNNSFANTTSSPLKLSLSFHSAIFTYSGWNGLNFVAEELKNAEKDLPIASFAGLALVVVFYLLVNVSYVFVLTPEEIKASSATVVAFGKKLSPPFGYIFSFVVSISILGFLNGELFGGPRVLFAAARDGQMPIFMRFLIKRKHTPAFAVVMVGVMTTLFLAVQQVDSLVLMASFAEVITYLALSVTFFIHRFRQRGKPRGSKQTFMTYLVLGLIFFLVLVVVVVVSLVASPTSCAVAAAVIVGGMLFYPLVRYRFKDPLRFWYDGFNMFLQKLTVSVVGVNIDEPSNNTSEEGIDMTINTSSNTDIRI